jgi:hypothetical protein
VNSDHQLSFEEFVAAAETALRSGVHTPPAASSEKSGASVGSVDQVRLLQSDGGVLDAVGAFGLFVHVVVLSASFVRRLLVVCVDVMIVEWFETGWCWVKRECERFWRSSRCCG